MTAKCSAASARIALVIVSYKSERWLSRCLETVYAGEFEGRCWLVDNDSLAPSMRSDILARYPLVTYHRTDSNLGFGGANNIGIQFALRAGADIVGLINPDIWMAPGWCSPILAAFDQVAGLGLAAPLQLCYESDEPSEWARGAMGIASLHDPRLKESLIPVEWLEASAVFIRRDVFEVIGMFDPLFSLYYEDSDLCRRARLAGFRHAVVPVARYHHFGGGTLDGRAGIERAIRCDLGQALYTLTNPERKFGHNIIATVRLVIRRLLVAVRSPADGGRRFVGLVTRLGPLLWRERLAIFRKWEADAAWRARVSKGGSIPQCMDALRSGVSAPTSRGGE